MMRDTTQQTDVAEAAWYQFCHLNGNVWVLKQQIQADGPFGFLFFFFFTLNVCSRWGSLRSSPWNTWLSCLLILEERYSQPRAAEPFRGRPPCTGSHCSYTSHIHPPQGQRGREPTPSHTHTSTGCGPGPCVSRDHVSHSPLSGTEPSRIGSDVSDPCQEVNLFDLKIEKKKKSEGEKDAAEGRI